MRFIGYAVGDKKFGAGDKKSAIKYSEATGYPIKLHSYKI